jgi:hypothetical protein
MSRGGLLLRRAADGPELEYASVLGAVRHGKRPGRLEPRSWAGTKYAFNSATEPRERISHSSQSEKKSRSPS